MTRLLYTTLLLIPSIVIFGQAGYYVKNDTLFSGVKIIDGGRIINAIQCQVKGEGEISKYTTDEISEYGLKGGRVYLAKIINIQHNEREVFLERLCKGSINLYYYKDRENKKFFFEKDHGNLIELTEKDKVRSSTYRNTLDSLSEDCDNVSDKINLLSYNRSSLVQFVNQYNSCDPKPFPFLRTGILFGYGINHPVYSRISNVLLKNAHFKNDNTFVLGTFMDIPIFSSYFSFHPEIYYLRNAFSSHIEEGDHIYDIVINGSSINIPLLLRYTYPSLKVRPFINIGITSSRSIRNDNTIYTTVIKDDIIEIEEPDKNCIYSKMQVGYSIGGGIQFKIDYQKSITFEFRINNHYSLTYNNYGNRSAQIVSGLNF